MVEKVLTAGTVRGKESCLRRRMREEMQMVRGTSGKTGGRRQAGSGREAAMQKEKRHRKMRNPLGKRVRRELTGEWAKYLVIALFLIGMIGAVSGMYVANGSMLKAADESVEKYRLEDGHFELKEKAEPELIRAIESGEKADLLSYYKKKAHDKVDEKLDEEFDAKFGQSAKDSGAYQEAYDKARDEAYQKADEEVEKKYAEAEDKYDLNDKDFQARPVTVYENFYKETTEVRDAAKEETSNAGDPAGSAQKEAAGASGAAAQENDNDAETGGKIRVYPVRRDIDLACIMDGALPSSENEIAIDRMHADNAGLKVGDRIAVGGEDYTISGLVANVDYSTLFEKNTDMMFDAIGFDVGLLTQSGFERLRVREYGNLSVNSI